MDFQREIKRRKSEKEEDEPIKPLDSLPQEIALDIISRLPIKSLIQFRFVSRFWHMLSHDPHLVHLHMSRTLTDQRLCLIFHSDYPIRNQLHFVEFSDVDEKEIVRKIETPFADSMPEFSIIGSCNGLLCLIDSLLADSLYIYNPFTRDYVVLPKSIYFQDQIVIFGFGFHPITKDYKVIKIAYYPKPHNLNFARGFRRVMNNALQRSDVQIYSLSRNEWRSVGEIPYRLDPRSSPGVLVNGRLHWMSHWRRDKIIVSYNLYDDAFDIVPKPNTTACSLRSWRNCHVSVLGGCLCVSVALRSGNGVMDIWVMKEYGVEESWVKEFSLGAYFPKLISLEMQASYPIWKNFLGGQLVRILCLLKNGEILVEYKGGTLVSYNPDSRLFKNLTFQGMPKLFRTTVHVGSLAPIAVS